MGSWRHVVRTVVIAPVFIVVTGALAGVIAVSSVIKQDNHMIEKILHWWSGFFIQIGGGTFATTGQEHIDPSGQYLFVANHESNLDVAAMFLSTTVPIRYLAKKELFKIPIFAQAMKGAGIIKTDRQAGKEAHSAINEGIAEATRRGHSIIIFPEGTRSETGELLPFKKGAFRIAIANQLPIIPISIEGTWEMWKPGKKVVRPGSVVTKVHPAISTADLTLSDLQSLSDQCRDIITADLQTSEP